MKTERRHELQTNELASTLAHWTESAKPYGRLVLAGILALIVAIIVWGYIANQNQARLAEGWDDYFQSAGIHDEQRMQDVAEQFSGTPVADWARLTVADWNLDSGTNRLLTDRAIARDQLRDAAEKYESLLLANPSQTIVERATFGLARAQEASGDLEKARSTYRSLAEKWPNSPFAAACVERAQALDSPQTKQFYDWIAKYEPPKSLSQEPGTPGARPDFLKEPDAGTLQLPSSLNDKSAPFPSLPGAGAPADAAPASGEPAATPDASSATPAAEPAPAENNSADGPQL